MLFEHGADLLIQYPQRYSNNEKACRVIKNLGRQNLRNFKTSMRTRNTEGTNPKAKPEIINNSNSL